MTVEQAYRECKKFLEKTEVIDPAFETMCIFEQRFSINRAGLITHGRDEFSEQNLRELYQILDKRAKKQPLQYILGSWEFCGFEFFVGEGVLIPRDDTEVVLNLCLEFLDKRQSKKAIDLCAGSGAISVALNKLANADVTAVELSREAFAYLEKNSVHNQADINLINGDVFKCYDDFDDSLFDLIVSNPPYIRSEDLTTLQDEVQKEPAMALDGGADGFDFYRSIIKNWSRKLKKGGALAFELGEDQADYVAELLHNEGFSNLKTAYDLSGIKRAIIGIRF